MKYLSTFIFCFYFTPLALCSGEGQIERALPRYEPIATAVVEVASEQELRLRVGALAAGCFQEANRVYATFPLIANEELYVIKAHRDQELNYVIECISSSGFAVTVRGTRYAVLCDMPVEPNVISNTIIGLLNRRS